MYYFHDHYPTAGGDLSVDRHPACQLKHLGGMEGYAVLKDPHYHQGVYPYSSPSLYFHLTQGRNSYVYHLIGKW